jgi:uncharacterized protein (TIGR02246 family)
MSTYLHGSGALCVVLEPSLGTSADAESRRKRGRLTSSVGDEAGIRSTLQAYNAALNGGTTDAVLPLYTTDGIFMPPYSPPAIGQAAVRSAYDAVFHELKFNVKFDIAELVEMAPTWAYVRTNSAGTTLHHATGKTTNEANQELFIFRKSDDGRWRIARYSFSPTSPPAH